MPSSIRRPRPAVLPAFLPAPALPIPRPRPSLRRTTCSTTPPTSQPSTTNSERRRAVHTRLETTRARVRLLNSRVIVRVGSADIQLAEKILSDLPAAPPSAQEEPSTDRDPTATARLRRDLRALRRLCEEHPSDDTAAEVVAQLDRVVVAVSKKLARPRVIDVDATPHEEVEEIIEGGGRVAEDSRWDGGQPEVQGEVGVVETVKRKVVEKGDVLKRKASNVGAGIEEKVGEFVKDDGSIDVDGLRQLVGGLLDTAGMTWKRLNGELVDGKGAEGVAGAAVDDAYERLSVQDPEKEFHLREEIGVLEKRLNESSKEREAVLRREDQLGLLIRAKDIRLMDDGVSALRRTLAVRVLQLEMQKIFASVAEEIEKSDVEMMMEQRVLVAEFGDLDERMATLELYIEQEEPLLIDDDIMGELAADIQDLKTRLGLDEPLYSAASLSWPQTRQFFASSAKKTREGAEFYSRGMRLFAGDMRFAMRLIRRAVLGYTPSPREIRTIRRTARDLLTLIPFTVVLIAPLTPVGHVLIFGFLQRYWPEFFPSTFSERRQAVMKRHEQYAKSLGAKENDSPDESGEEGGPGRKGSRGGGGGGGGRLAWLRKLLFFGVLANEAEENDSDTDEAGKGTSATSRNGVDTGEKLPGVDKNGLTKEGETSRDGQSRSVALSDLAESAMDVDQKARKKRSSMALEELHLAD